MVASACVVSRPHGVSGVQGGSACGPSTLWRSEVAVLVVRCRSHLVVAWSQRFPIFGVPAALAGKGLVIPTGPWSRGPLPLLPSARGSSSRELSVGRVAEATVAPCVVSNSESECCELLYLSELRVTISSNPSGSSDPLVATRSSGSLAGVREVGSLQLVCGFPARFVCVLQVGCSCCCVACVASVIARCVRAMVAWLAMDSLAVVSPVWRIVASKSRHSALRHLRRIWVCVPLWLREPTCCVTFTALVRGSRSLSLLVLAEVRFPQNCVVLIFGCRCVSLWVEVHRLVALCSGGVFQNLCLGISGQGVVPLTVCLAAALARLPCCSFPSFSAALSQCSVFYVLFGADVVVALSKLSAFRVLLLWVSGEESPSVGLMSSWAVGAVVYAAP
ncbi:hypothetical protein Taro_014079 [Colocasia esculenta]|uniref:Uncharacterized protein n=1 Tax=Colocasia esculenta TaxID=4460 RepID=A0A843UP38_COLES|nr:hypothetical protein [Colocasia esculenta]